MVEVITLPRWLVQRLLKEAQERRDFEVCGLIGGREGRPVSIYPVANVAKDPRTEFEMDPEGLIKAFKAMRARDEELFAIYHSHPKTPARPSERDLELLAYEEALYLIISLGTKGVLELRGFRVERGELIEVPLGLADEG